MIKLPPIIRNTALAGTIALAGIGGMTSCSCSNENNVQTEQTIHPPVLTSKKPMDFSKPNLPVIDDDNHKISYRNVDGDVIEIDNYDEFQGGKRTKALFQAINKFSTKEKPDIEDVEAFYCEVEKNNIYARQGRNDNVRCSMLLKNLYDMFTNPASEGGKTITVKEYTHMMDAWSSVI